MKTRLTYKSRLLLIALCLALAAMVGCGGEEGSSKDEDTPSGPPLSCESSEDLPCSFGEVEAGGNRQLVDILFDAKLKLLDGQTPADVAGWIEQQDGVAQVRRNEEAIRFRLQNGRPGEVWIPAMSGDLPAPVAPTQDTTRTRSSELVVQTEGRPRDQKRAIVLAPFQWEFHNASMRDSEISIVESTLARHPDYQHADAVDSYPDAEAGLDRFRGWEDYEVVHLATHGTCFVGEDDECEDVGLLTGEHIGPEVGVSIFGDDQDAQKIEDAKEAAWKALDAMSAPGLYVSSAHTVDNGGNNTVFFVIGVMADFFRAEYGRGLDETFMFINGCESLTPAGADIGRALVGQDSVYLGWDAAVNNPDAVETVRAMYEQLVVRGYTPQVALEKLGDKRTDRNGTRLERMGDDDRDVRVREVVAVTPHEASSTPGSDQNFPRLQDGANLTPFVAGRVGDGANDSLRPSIIIEGVDPDSPPSDDYKLVFKLNGSQIGDAYPLTAHGQQIPQIPWAWTVDDLEIPIGRDITPGEGYDLEVQLQLPDGDHSVFEASDLRVNSACNAKFSAGPIVWASTQARPDESFGSLLSTTTSGQGFMQLKMVAPDGSRNMIVSTEVPFDGPRAYPAIIVATSSGETPQSVYGVETPDDDAGEPVYGTLQIDAISGDSPHLLASGIVQGPVEDPDTETAYTATAQFTLPISMVNYGAGSETSSDWNAACGLQTD